MTTQILGYTPIKIPTLPGVYFIPNFKTDDLINEDLVRTHKLQRDHARRWKKMVKHFRKQLPTLYNFSILKITKSITGTVNGEEITVDQGFDMVDGHTRRHDIQVSLRTGENSYPSEVPVMVYEINSFKEYKDLYDSFDSIDATDKSSDKIIGALRLLDIILDSNTGRSGGFGTALSIAYPGDSKDDVLKKVAYFKDEIQCMDSIGLFNPESKEFKSQCLIAAGLMALKYYNKPDTSRARIIGGLTRIAKAKKNMLDHSDPKSWYGLDCIEYEFLTEPGKWISKDLHRKTSYTAVDDQMNFFWYCLENYMSKTTISKHNGVKKSSFKGKYTKYRDGLLATQPIDGYEFIDIEDEEFDNDE
jgi:hypothetical protein